MAKIQLLIFSMVLGLCASCSSSNTNSQAAAETVQDTEPRQNNDNSAIDIESGIYAEIKKEIDFSNSKCPISLGMGNNVTLESIAYEDNSVIYYYSLDRINDGVGNNDSFKSTLLYMLKGEAGLNAANKRFFDNIIKAGAKIIYVYQSHSGKSLTIEISNKELRDIFEE